MATSSQPEPFVAGVILLLLLAVAVVIGLALFAFWQWMLAHAATNPGIEQGEKIARGLIMIFVSLLGSVIYFFIGRPKARLAQRS
jgi:type II secretory pathway component PulK